MLHSLLTSRKCRAGTGKSTLVCALCVGLAGSPTVSTVFLLDCPSCQTTAFSASELCCAAVKSASPNDVPAPAGHWLYDCHEWMQLLGRADVMAEFVLQGEAEGWVEITLSKDDEGRPIVFRRQLRAKDNGSDWRIDGIP